jgi:hypothetical protein
MPRNLCEIEEGVVYLLYDVMFGEILLTCMYVCMVWERGVLYGGGEVERGIGGRVLYPMW